MMETVLQRMAARTAAMRRSAVTGSSVVIWRLRTPGLRSVMTATKRAQTDARRSAWLRYAVMVGSTPTKPVMMGTESRQTAAPARASPPAAAMESCGATWSLARRASSSAMTVTSDRMMPA